MAITLIKQNPGPAAMRESGYLSGTYTAATVANADMTTTNAAASSGAVLAGDGTLVIKPGFRPKYFKIINCTDRVTQEWFEGLAAGNYLETAANGDKTLETDSKIVVGSADSGSAPVTIQGNGDITVTFDSGIATDNDTVVWEVVG